MILLQAEWMRLMRNRVSVAMLLCVLVLVLVSATDGGLRAAEYRAYLEQQHANWLARTDELRRDTKIIDAAAPGQPVASATFEFGRTEAPSTPRAALGGLALSPRSFVQVPANVRVTLESRYLDVRRTEVIDNPLISKVGVPDFSVVVSLLLPLLIIGLTYGVVQEPREQGIWRMVLAQTARPWRALLVALFLRWSLATLIVAVASAVAFAIDGQSDARTWLLWMSGVGICALWWVSVAGLFNLLRMSSAATAIALLSAWLITSFAAPAMLVAYAEAQAPGPSRLAALREVREVQHSIEMREPELVARWYEEHPQHKPESITSHAFPVTFVPKYLEQDRTLVPLMHGFDRVKSERVELMAPLLWAAPGPALVLLADELAGHSARQQSEYMEWIATIEREWRSVFVPAVMSYRGLSNSDVDTIAAIDLPAVGEQQPLTSIWAGAVGALVLVLGLLVGRRGARAGN